MKPATLSDNQTLVLLYMNGVTVEPPGLTVQQVVAATDLSDYQARTALEALYVRRLVGRQRPLLGGSGLFWMPVVPAEPLELKGPSDEPMQATFNACRGCGRPVKGSGQHVCSSCRLKGEGAAWEDLDASELKVMQLIDCYGDAGLPFAKTQRFGAEASRAIQALQRRGIAGVDLSRECWAFGTKGRSIMDSWRKAHPSS